MKFKSIALPKPSEGVDYKSEKDEVVPDQSMSLEYILQRFTRGEPLSVGHDVTFVEEVPGFLDVDLEKLATSDLVDKEEYIDMLRKVKVAYDKQEKKKADDKAAEDALKAKAAEQKRIRIEARKLAKGSFKTSA